MWWLVALACGGASPTETERPAEEVAPVKDVATEEDDCVSACLRERMAEAVAPEIIEAQCQEQCGEQPITTRAGVKGKSGERVRIRGELVRRSAGEAEGTAVVLTDGTAVWITYGEPPHGWAGLVGKEIAVDGELWDGPPQDVDRTGLWLEEPHLTGYDAPIPVGAVELKGPPPP